MKSINSGEPKGVRPGGRSIAALIASAAIVAMLAGCGGGGGGGGGNPNPINVALSGTFTYAGHPQAAGYTITVEGAAPANSTTTNSSSQYSLTVKSNQTITLDVIASGAVYTSQVVNVGNSATQTANIAVTTGAPPPPPL